MRTKTTRSQRMQTRWLAQINRVGDKAVEREEKRIRQLWRDGRISIETRGFMLRTARERLAYIAGVTAPGSDHA